MKVCRWLGCLLLVAGLAVLVGPKFSAFAGPQAQGKEKKEQAKKDQGKKESTKTEAPTGATGSAGGWKWEAFNPAVNKEYYQTLATITNQKLKVMGMEVVQDQNQTFYIKWIPQPPDAKGDWVVIQKIIGVKMDIDIGGTKISYDSTAASQPQNPMTDFFKALLDADLKFTIGKDLKVIKIEGNEELVKKLSKTNPQMEQLLKSILSEEALKKMTEPTLFAFPVGGVKTWKKESTLTLSQIGTYKTDYTFTVDGKEQGDEKIDIKATLAYTKPTEKGKLPFTIENGELTGKDGTGYALFNPAKGRFDSYEMKMKIEGNLTIDIAGMKTQVDLIQNQTATVKTSDSNPIASAAPATTTPAKK